MSKQEIKLTDAASFFGNGTLHCPACDGHFLHQGRVDIFNRIEDAHDGTHVMADGNAVSSNRDMTGNPSSRRHGLIIKFKCESCPADVSMNIYQHRGNTLMSLDFDMPKVEATKPDPAAKVTKVTRVSSVSSEHSD